VGRARQRADGAAAGRERRGGGQRRRRERERRERRKKNGRKLYFLTLPSARDPALDKDFFKILKYSLPGARSRALGKDDFAECHVAMKTLGKDPLITLCRVSFVDTRRITFLFFLFSQPKFLWCVTTLYRPTCTIFRQLEKCFQSLVDLVRLFEFLRKIQI
jgi:hypothetical protein